MTMKISQEANDRDLAAIKAIQEVWKQDEEDVLNNMIKITIYAKKKLNWTRSPSIAGIAFTDSWWKVLDYWLSTKLQREGFENIRMDITSPSTGKVLSSRL